MDYRFVSDTQNSPLLQVNHEARAEGKWFYNLVLEEKRQPGAPAKPRVYINPAIDHVYISNWSTLRPSTIAVLQRLVGKKQIAKIRHLMLDYGCAKRTLIP